MLKHEELSLPNSRLSQASVDEQVFVLRPEKSERDRKTLEYWMGLKEKPLNPLDVGDARVTLGIIAQREKEDAEREEAKKAKKTKKTK